MPNRVKFRSRGTEEIRQVMDYASPLCPLAFWQHLWTDNGRLGQSWTAVVLYRFSG